MTIVLIPIIMDFERKGATTTTTTTIISYSSYRKKVAKYMNKFYKTGCPIKKKKPLTDRKPCR